VTAEPHAHELDGKLHPKSCAMCALIVERRGEMDKRERDADAMATRYARIADRTRKSAP